MDNPRRHHYVPQHYLRRWTLDGRRLVVVKLPVSDGGFVASVKNVAVESDLYAIETPEGLDQTVERDITRPIDAAFARAVDGLLRGDFDAVNPLDLVTAVAFQFARGPQSKAHLEYIKTEIARVKEEFGRLFRGEEVDEAALARIADKPLQNEWVASLLASVASMTSIFGEMRLHFVYFPEPWLVTSDSPISLWRRESLEKDNIGVGIKSVDEVRLPLAPTLALVMTWEPGAPQAISGNIEMARELNIGTSEFAHRHRIFCRPPEPFPPFPTTEAELARRPVAADLSVLPPMHVHQHNMRATFAEDLQNIPELKDLADRIAQTDRQEEGD